MCVFIAAHRLLCAYMILFFICLFISPYSCPLIHDIQFDELYLRHGVKNPKFQTRHNLGFVSAALRVWLWSGHILHYIAHAPWHYCAHVVVILSKLQWESVIFVNHYVFCWLLCIVCLLVMSCWSVYVCCHRSFSAVATLTQMNVCLSAGWLFNMQGSAGLFKRLQLDERGHYNITLQEPAVMLSRPTICLVN